MTQRNIQFGRTLMETIAVLVVAAILLLAGLVGYNAVIHKYRKDQTVKAISELSVRYKLRPVKPDGEYVNIKTVYPEATRASTVEMKTLDTDSGRVSLHVEDTSSFSVVVNHILADSCESALENGDFDSVLYKDGLEEFNKSNEYVAIGKDLLQNWSSLSDSQKPQELRGKTKDEVIAYLCHDEAGKIRNLSLVSGDNCPSAGASYWYGGKCWNCAKNKAQDDAGNCCAKGEIDACGYCPGKCPNGGVCDEKGTKLCVECTEEKQDNCTANDKVCDKDTKQCVDCLTPGDECAGEIEAYCTKYHTCEACDTTDALRPMRWNAELDMCECKTPRLSLNASCSQDATGSCCVEGTICHDGKCQGCWLDYNPAQPTLEGSCPADRPFCHEGVCEGCPTIPTAAEQACVPLCGCDTSKGLGCNAGVCKCNLWTGKALWNADLAICTTCTAGNKTACSGRDCELTTGNCCPADKPFWDNGKEECVKCLVDANCAGVKVCNQTTKTCVCPSTTTACGTQCCANGCNPSNNTQCAECDEDTDCEGNKGCNLGTRTCCPTTTPYACGTQCCANGCDPSNSTRCAECDEDTDCEGNKGCNLGTRTCCPTTTPYACGTQCCANGCDPSNSTRCAECDEDTDCEGNKVCDITHKTCVPMVCTELCPDQWRHRNCTYCCNDKYQLLPGSLTRNRTSDLLFRGGSSGYDWTTGNFYTCCLKEKVYAGNQCCDGTVYDNRTKCCIGTVYTKNGEQQCCSGTVTNGKCYVTYSAGCKGICKRCNHFRKCSGNSPYYLTKSSSASWSIPANSSVDVQLSGFLVQSCEHKGGYPGKNLQFTLSMGGRSQSERPNGYGSWKNFGNTAAATTLTATATDDYSKNHDGAAAICVRYTQEQ